VPSGSKSRHFKRQASQEFWSLSHPPPANSRERESCSVEVEQARETYARLRQQRNDTPRKIRLGDVSDGDPVKLTYERKLLTDTIKMGAYDVETQLMEMLDGVFRRNDWEGRAVVREIFQTSGDLTLSPGQLHIHLDQRTALHAGHDVVV
jgi:hypothetical protein